jgi:hypothetical protein
MNGSSVRFVRKAGQRGDPSLGPFPDAGIAVGAAVYVSFGVGGVRGFANLFVQAAARRIPIASLEVRTPLIDGTGAEDSWRMVIWTDWPSTSRRWSPSRGQRAGEAGRRIVGGSTLRAVVDRLIELLRKAPGCCEQPGCW